MKIPIKRLDVLAFVGFVIGVVVVSVVIGPVLGYRRHDDPPVFDVVSTVRHGSQVDITVHNNESHPVVGHLWYTMARPGDGTIAYASPGLDIGPLLPKQTQDFSLQVPETLAQGFVITASVTETIRYIGSTGIPQPVVQPLPGPDEVQYQSVVLERSTSSSFAHLKIAFTLVNIDPVRRTYRYQVSLDRLENSRRAYTSRFQIGRFEPGVSVPLVFEDDMALEKGSYTLTIWFQVQTDAGDFLHHQQAIYSRPLGIK